jgi:hypothetical protein
MTATFPVPLIANDGETLATSSTIAIIGIPPSFQQVKLGLPTQDHRVHFNPALRDAVFYDDSAESGAKYKNTGKLSSLQVDLTDRSTNGASGTLLDAMTTSDILYLCFANVIGGFRVVMISGSVNTTNSVIDVEYYKNDDTWANLTETDGTISSSKTLAQTGNVTFTAPADWLAIHLKDKLTTLVTPKTEEDAPNTYGFWIRIKVGTALSANVEIDEIWAINKDTRRGYYEGGMNHVISVDRRSVGAIEMVAASSTDTAELTWLRS